MDMEFAGKTLLTNTYVVQASSSSRIRSLLILLLYITPLQLSISQAMVQLFAVCKGGCK